MPVSRVWIPWAMVLLCLVTTGAAVAQSAPLRFGILPTGGPSESLADWRPVLDDLAAVLGREVDGVSVSSYEGMYRAVADGRVDIAFLSGQLAKEAVLNDGMEVLARLARQDGSRGYHSVLIVRDGGPVRDLEAVFSESRRWTYARGQTVSVSGYLVPEAQLFARRGLDSDLLFKAVMVDNHQNTALAVVNGEADLASNNTADLELFARRFPAQHSQLREIWRSNLIPHAVLVIDSELPAELRSKVRAFFLGYGRGQHRAVARERENLRRFHNLSGFDPAGNTALLPFAEIEYMLALQRAQTARWVDEKARLARIQRLTEDFERISRRLNE